MARQSTSTGLMYGLVVCSALLAPGEALRELQQGVFVTRILSQSWQTVCYVYVAVRTYVLQQ